MTDFSSSIKIDDLLFGKIYTFKIKILNQTDDKSLYSNSADVDSKCNNHLCKWISLIVYSTAFFYKNRIAKLNIELMMLGEFAEGTTSTLECNSKINSNLINYTWYKNNERVNLQQLNANLTDNKLNFYNLSHLAVDDFYWCEMQVLKTAQTIRSDPLLLQVKRNFCFYHQTLYFFF